MSLESQAAALAAFKGLQKDNIPGTKKPFKIPQLVTTRTSSSEGLPGSPITQRPKSKKTSSSQTLPKLDTKLSPNNVGHSKQSNSIYDVKDIHVLLSVTNPNASDNKKSSFDYLLLSGSPLETTSGASGTDYFTLSPKSIYRSPQSTYSVQSTHSNLSVNHTRTQETLSNLKASLQSKITSKDSLSRRKSLETAPHDMLARMKQSIADKSISTNAHDANKNSEKINEIRDSIDLKRITTSVNTIGLHLDSDYMSDGNYVLNNSSIDVLPQLKPSARSFKSTSLYDPILENTDQPDIVKTDTHEMVSPALLSGNFIEADVASYGSSDQINYLKPSYKPKASFDSMSEENKIKLKRKPPPFDVSNNIISVNSRVLHDYSYSSETEDDKDKSKFPQFPDIDDKKSKDQKHHMFKKRYSVRGNDNIELPGEENFEGNGKSSAPSTNLANQQHQPVQLKTTMRKDKRSKKQFNEDKPWKNHTDLIYITERERKRYEGIWVSNKGLYVNQIVTKLRGINYNDESSKVNGLGFKDELINPSITAAQLSSSQHETIDNFERFHNLDMVEPQNLIVAPVVKRIWARSKLPNETLQQIWELVDHRKDGTLNKPEFLVGMWVVDQCLYGRKLPKKIENETWASLESIGLNVVLKKRGKR